MAYPTADEIAQGSTELEALTTEQLDALYAASIFAVEDYCGQSFGGTYDGVREVESMRSRALYLPQRIIELRQVLPYSGDVLDPTAIAITHEGARLLFRVNVVGVGYYEQAIQEVSDYSYLDEFPEGTVYVDGLWGWQDCPPSVAMALRLDMTNTVQADNTALTPTVNYMRAMGINSIAQGNLNLSLDTKPNLSPVVAAMLDPFVFMGTPPGRLV